MMRTWTKAVLAKINMSVCARGYAYVQEEERRKEKERYYLCVCCIYVCRLKYFCELRSSGLGEVLRKRKEEEETQ